MIPGKIKKSGSRRFQTLFALKRLKYLITPLLIFPGIMLYEIISGLHGMSPSTPLLDMLQSELYHIYNPVNLTMTLLLFGDNFRSRNAKNTHDTSFES